MTLLKRPPLFSGRLTDPGACVLKMEDDKEMVTFTFTSLISARSTKYQEV